MPRKKSWFRASRLGGVAFVALPVAMIVLNPSEKRQRDALYDAYRRKRKQRDGEKGALVATVLKHVDAFRAFPYEYHNFYLFSTRTLQGGRATFGVLGTVRGNDEAIPLEQ